MRLVSDGFGLSMVWCVLSLYVWSEASTNFATAFHVTLMLMLYIPIWDHFVSGSNRVNAGQIGYAEVFLMEIIMSVCAAIWGSDIFKYNLLNFIPFIPEE